MGCSGCGSKVGGTPTGCGNNGHCASGGCSKLEVYDWLSDISAPAYDQYDIHEISFKDGARKEFFRNNKQQDIETGDYVLVETDSAGYDIGKVTLSGELVKLQMKKKLFGKGKDDEPKNIIRIAKDFELEKLKEARSKEKETMLRARVMARDLGLDMKLGDVEFQADLKKATFFYTAEERVDFRELIKVLAKEFHVKIDMRQIGSRQEAGRVGGIGSCGRELCCSTWLTNFKSVNTTAARYQNLSINQTKLSGQCGRLKCCLNYELDTYLDALRSFPKEDDSKKIKTQKGIAYLFKTDVLRGIMTYSYNESSTFYPLKLEDVKMLLEMNAKGQEPEDLTDFMIVEADKEVEDFEDLVGQISLAELEKGIRKNKSKDNRKPAARDDRRPKGNDFKDKVRKDRPKENKPMMGLPENKLVMPEKLEPQPGNKPKNKKKKRRKPNRDGGNPPPPQA
jgi:cell fate regulator YaaT (PSP1 superfamily)